MLASFWVAARAQGKPLNKPGPGRNPSIRPSCRKGEMGIRRCYGCDQASAVYEAHLDHDATPVVLLCVDCAAWERAARSVVWIRTISAGEATESPPKVTQTRRSAVNGRENARNLVARP
jgi:hypothetical protein